MLDAALKQDLPDWPTVNKVIEAMFEFSK